MEKIHTNMHSKRDTDSHDDRSCKLSGHMQCVFEISLYDCRFSIIPSHTHVMNSVCYHQDIYTNL